MHLSLFYSIFFFVNYDMFDHRLYLFYSNFFSAVESSLPLFFPILPPPPPTNFFVLGFSWRNFVMILCWFHLDFSSCERDEFLHE